MIFFPKEVLANIFFSLPDQQLLKLRETCSAFQNSIDQTLPLQTRIANFYLFKNQYHANIPLDRIKYGIFNGDLAVEIEKDHYLLCFLDKLTRVLPSVKHLILNECESSTIKTFFGHLKDSKLKTLVLSKCLLDESCITALKELTQEKIGHVFLCDPKWDTDCDLSDLRQSDKIIEVPLEQASLYHIKNMETQSMSTALASFKGLVSEYKSVDEILEAFDSLGKITQLSIVTSIWYKAFVIEDKRNGVEPIDAIYRQVREYIKKHPDRPVILTAARVASLT